MGFEKFTHLIQNTFPLTFSDLFEKKLQLIWLKKMYPSIKKALLVF
jgi:hypothetical protein